MPALPTVQSSLDNLPNPDGTRNVVSKQQREKQMSPTEQRRQKLYLKEKIKLAARQLENEKKAREDLEKRTSGLQKRIEQLESVAPVLRQAQDTFFTFAEEQSPERQEQFRSTHRRREKEQEAQDMEQLLQQRQQSNTNNETNRKTDSSNSQRLNLFRSRNTFNDVVQNQDAIAASRESFRLNSGQRQRSATSLPTKPFATSALSQVRYDPAGNAKAEVALNEKLLSKRKEATTNSSTDSGLVALKRTEEKSNTGRITDQQHQLASSSSSTNNNDKSFNQYAAQKQLGASHSFPNLSSFFSYPERDEHGFLIPHGRSSKRTAFAVTYANEHILGESEISVNRRRMKRAEEVYQKKEQEAIDRILQERKLALEKKKEELKEAGALATDIADLYPVKPSARPTILYTPRDSKRPGESKTGQMAVHNMPRAGKNLLQIFESGDHKFKSSRRTLFYTDYTGKPFMIDCQDMPRRDGFVLTGL